MKMSNRSFNESNTSTQSTHLLSSSNPEQPRSSNKTHSTHLKTWSAEPQPLTRRWKTLIFGFIGDFILLGLWVFILWYAFAVLHYDGVQTDSMSMSAHTLIEIGKYTSTAFPILFAATLGRCLRVMALWRLERGERIGLLDQLISSTSVVNTILTQIHLQTLGVLAVLLVTLWLLSPLGSQAAQRTAGLGVANSTSHGPLTHLAMGGYENLISRGSDASSWNVPGNTVYLAAFASPGLVKNSTMDLYQNVKIPFLHRVTEFSSPDASGWYAVHAANLSAFDYSAQLGIPATNVSTSDNSSFNIDTSYWTLDCPIIKEGGPYMLRSNITTYGSAFTMDSNSSWLAPLGNRSQYRDELVTSKNESSIALGRRQIYFLGYPLNGATYAECYISNTYVEVAVSCLSPGPNCSVVQMRESLQPHPPNAWTQLDFNDTLSYRPTFLAYMENFAKVIPGRSSYANPFSNYFINPDSPFDFDFSSNVYVTLWNMTTPERFCSTLAQLMNTYYLASIGRESFTVSGSKRLQRLAGWAFNVQSPIVTNTTVTYTRSNPIFTCNKSWLAALLVSSIIPFAAVILTIALESRRHGPILSMNISTVLRDNPYVGLPPGGSILDDSDRSKATKNLRVRFGDVVGEDEVGHVAIGRSELVSRLRRGRLYA